MQRRMDVSGAMSAALEGTMGGAHAATTPHLVPSLAAPSASPVLLPRGVTPPTTPHHHTHHLPSTVQASLLLLQGKLLRRDRTFLTWKWRDFYLERHRLQYFNEKGDRKGEIIITATTPIMMRLLNEPKPFAFLLFIKDEKLTLAAATAQDRQKWLDVFRDVFHANIEDCQTNGQATDKQEKKRMKPTFLPIPDMSSEDESSAISAAAKGVVAPPGSQGSNRSSFTGRVSDGAMGIPVTAAALAGATSGPSVTGALDADRRTHMRTSEGAITIENAQKTKFVALKEQYSNVTFPRSLANGEVLVGVGPLVRRMSWTDERILAVGFYVEAEAAAKELQRFHGRTLKSVCGDQAFYDYVVQNSKFRRTFVVTSRKRVSKSVLTALLHDEIAPRIGGSTVALDTFLSFIEKSLRKAESMMLRINPDGGRFEFRLRGQQYPPIASSLLGQCIQAVFFDVNSIQQDAKRRLIERFPLLWGMEEVDDPLASLVGRDQDVLSDRRKGGGTTSESDDDDDDEYDDEGEGNDDGGVDSHRHRGDSQATRQMQRNLSIKEELDELDEQEHELLRRESRSLGVHFGPIVDRDSNAHFRGDLLLDGSTLMGTWSQKMNYSIQEPAVPSAQNTSGAFTDHSCVVSVGLYIETGGASETLLKYKGLSVGSILQDPDFFARFAEGAFTKHLMLKVQDAMPVAKLIDYFTARVRRRGSGAGAPGSDGGRSSDSKIRLLMDRLNERSIAKLRPEDELLVSISIDGKMTLTVNRMLSSEDCDTVVPVDNMMLATAPVSTIFQSIFYGYHTMDPASRWQLMERLPSLLDMAKDDLAHTYHDEIQVLKENYKRQLPEFRLKAGYLLISFEKKKMAKNADGVKEPTITPSRWSKRWCRLDGATFSYFSHKRSKKAREIVDLTECTVSEITSSSTSTELAPFALEKAASTRPSIRIGIAKRNGEILALKTESIYEGVEWLESLVEASQVQRSIPVTLSVINPDTIQNDGGNNGRLSEDIDGLPVGQIEDEDVFDGGEDTAESTVEEDEDERHGHAFTRGARSQDVSTVKHGSLIAWILEDSRHAFIFALILFIVWLVTIQESPANTSL